MEFGDDGPPDLVGLRAQREDRFGRVIPTPIKPDIGDMIEQINTVRQEVEGRLGWLEGEFGRLTTGDLSLRGSADRFHGDW
ncbi:hypothetical protein OG921_15845 [Aldersonia sp. NBC_00410]|uniref:hypothetical protein n=1 Tax=Aldersonia sp. NBC_00410 TaxID=2975954 RepID=UPI0022562885|nr:hypothetical protein [Aldersonia sp. NBC_00410]MCX5044642.1 hypothetical protein [Aldersonia sp. NBC_00410]